MHFINKDKDWFQACLKNESLVEKLKKIKLIISDIDGCMTDGRGYYSDHHEIQKCFSIQDGYLMAKCNKENMPHLALISGRTDKAAEQRAKILNIPNELYYAGVDSDKPTTVKAVQQYVGVSEEETLFFGDDLLDVATTSCVGLFTAPSNALFYIQDNADIISPRSGGNGALRMILDLLLYVQGKHIAQELIEKSL